MLIATIKIAFRRDPGKAAGLALHHAEQLPVIVIGCAGRKVEPTPYIYGGGGEAQAVVRVRHVGPTEILQVVYATVGIVRVVRRLRRPLMVF